ncbi:GMC family oxidoreductase [Phormidium tenue FACHB-886]|nr:GMC family oxidoreductase [Phormidium tenue FACHB-886]
MLVDARSLSDNETIETEVCIVGSGPAGMTIARELIGQNFRVCLLESGGLELDAETQSLAMGQTEGDFYTPLHEIRQRRCGGTANTWDIKFTPSQTGVRYVPLDPIDFEQRDWVPYSGWAINRSDLDPYYDRAQTVCQIGPYSYDTEAWADAQTPVLPFKGDRIVTSMFQFGPSSAFTQDCRDQVKQSKNVTLYLNANVVELETNATASMVTGVRVACLSGQEFRVAAKQVILATGGVENVRLLLLSNRVQESGLGNHHDQLGRYFMDHPLVRTGMFFPNDRNIFNATAIYDWRRVKNTLVMGRLALSEKTLRDEKLLNTCAILFPRYPIHQFEAVAALKRLLGVSKRADNQSAIQDLLKAATGVHKIVGAAYLSIAKRPPLREAELDLGGWSQMADKPKKLGYFEVIMPTEQAPDPDNRLTLSEERDRLGCPRVKLHWRWRDIDIQSLKRTQVILAEEIAKSGLGRLEIARNGDLPQILSPGMHHPMGGTRMHADPRQGVVDANCKVHGVSNLFVAGTSVFPTGGFANPTLTIVAMSIRLADEVKRTVTANQELAV